MYIIKGNITVYKIAQGVPTKFKIFANTYTNAKRFLHVITDTASDRSKSHIISNIIDNIICNNIICNNRIV